MLSSVFPIFPNLAPLVAPRQGAVAATQETIAAQDTFDLSGTGNTVVEQSHQPVPKLIHVLNHLEHEKPDLSVTGEIHLNESLYG